MDRILRILPLAMAAAVFGLAMPAGQAAPNHRNGEGVLLAAVPAELSQGDGPVFAETNVETAPLDPSVVRLLPPVNDAPAEVSPPETVSPLKTAAAGHERSERLEQIARQVDRQTQHGFELAGRSAYFAARSEFLGALKLLADGLDTEQKTDIHGRALTAALTAMKEAEDFLPKGSRLESDADLVRIIAAHATPALKTGAVNVTATMALKSYFTFAQEQFAAATGDEVAGSMALYALGKLHNAMANKKSGFVAVAESKAMVYYQAAMLAHPGNFMAANDLGVLLAQCGNQAEARTILEHSLSLCPQSTTWHNLAVVYGQLGETTLAHQADQQAGIVQQDEIARRKMAMGTVNNSVVWIDPQAFAQTSANAPNVPGATPQPQTATAARPTNAGRLPSSAERMSWGSPAYQR